MPTIQGITVGNTQFNIKDINSANAILDLKDLISNNSKTIGLPVSVDLEYDSYYIPKRSGDFYYLPEQEVWKATDYISTAGITKIYFQGISQGSGDVIVPLAFYDSNKIFISAAQTTKSGTHIETGVIEVPSNAAYFKQSRYINPNDRDIPNSNNYTKYEYFGAEYPIAKMFEDIQKFCVFGYLFSGYLEIDTQNHLLTVKIQQSNIIITTNQKAINTGFTNNQTFELPDANNYVIMYDESSGSIIAKSSTLTGIDLNGCVVLGYYALGYIYGSLGVILVDGELKNKAFDFVNIVSDQITINKTNIASLVQTTNALASGLTSEESARQIADNALGARIDNLVAPSGTSVAEIIDARVGVDGETHSSLESRLNSEVGSLFNKVGNVRTVGPNKDYQTVGEAVNASAAGDIIYIYDGVYTERIVNRDKAISLIGQSTDGVIIQYPNDNYSRPPLEMAKGVIKNLTLHATSIPDTEPNAYALHCDFQGSGVIGGYLYCENVKFINDNYRAVGLGLRGNSHIEFVNCLFIASSEYEALYMHDANDTAYDINNQSVSFKNCTFHSNSTSKHTIEVVSQERQIGVVDVEWQRNIVVNDSTGGAIAMSFYQGRDLGADHWMGSSDWVLSSTSALNNIPELNNTK